MAEARGAGGGVGGEADGGGPSSAWPNQESIF